MKEMEMLRVVLFLCFLSTINAVAAPEFTIGPQDSEIHAGLSTDLKCSITNLNETDPALNKTIIWCKDNKTITDDVTVLKGVSTLHVTFNDSKHFATYGCGIETYECQKTLKIKIITTTTTTTTTTTMPTTTNPLTTLRGAKLTSAEVKGNEKSSAVVLPGSISTPGNDVGVVAGTPPRSSGYIPCLSTWLFGAILIRTVVLVQVNRLS